MKKVISLLLVVLLVAAMFVGCQSNVGMKDGTYRATYANAEWGWTEYLEVTVAEGKIASVDFDAVNEEGARKSEDQAYQDNMASGNKENGMPEIGPMQFFAEYEKALVDAQDINKVTAVAGATNAYNSLKTLYGALSKKMATGDTSTAVVDNPQE